MTEIEAPALARRAGEGGGWGRFRPALANWSLFTGVAIALPLAIAAPLGLATLMLVAAAGILVGDGWPTRVHRRFALASVVLLALVLWGGASALWSIDPERSATMAVRLALTLAAGGVMVDKALRLDRDERRRLAFAAALGTGTGVVLLLFEVATDQFLLASGRALIGSREPVPTMMNQATTFLTLVTWPTAYALHRYGRTGLALAFVLAGVATVSLLPNTTSMFAIATATIAGGLALVWPRFVRWAVVGGAIAGILLAPLAVSSFTGSDELYVRIKPSAVHRLMIWRFTTERIAERPWLGWGLESARELPGGEDEVSFTTSKGVWARQLLPLHTHNAALQFRLELGVIGVALFVGLLAAIGWSLRGVADRVGHAARMALLTAALTVAMASYGVWQFWWLAALALAVAVMVGVGLPGRHEMATSEETRSSP